MAKATKPAIAVDPIKNLIRIHKSTLHLLGDPDYIQLLVNPETMQIAIRASSKNDPLAHKIRWYELTNTKSYQLMSQKLLSELFKFNNDFEKTNIYRIYGDFLEAYNLVKFDMNNAKCEKVRVINNDKAGV